MILTCLTLLLALIILNKENGFRNCGRICCSALNLDMDPEILWNNGLGRNYLHMELLRNFSKREFVSKYSSANMTHLWGSHRKSRVRSEKLGL